MVIIKLTPEQTQLMLSANEMVYLHDSSGNTLGTAKKLPVKSAFSATEIEDALARAKNVKPEDGLTYEAVLKKLDSLPAENR
jgi:hypothetical protein